MAATTPGPRPLPPLPGTTPGSTHMTSRPITNRDCSTGPADGRRRDACLPRQRRPPRWPPAGTLLLPGLEHPQSSQGQNDQVGDGGYHHQLSPDARRIAFVVAGHGGSQRKHACVKHGGRREHPAGPQNSPLARRTGGRGARGGPGPASVTGAHASIAGGWQRTRTGHTNWVMAELGPGLSPRTLRRPLPPGGAARRSPARALGARVFPGSASVLAPAWPRPAGQSCARWR